MKHKFDSDSMIIYRLKKKHTSGNIRRPQAYKILAQQFRCTKKESEDLLKSLRDKGLIQLKKRGIWIVGDS